MSQQKRWISEDVKRFSDPKHRAELKRRAELLRTPLSVPKKPYKKREIDGWETRQHIDEYPWMDRRISAGFPGWRAMPGSHSFTIELPAEEFGMEGDDLLQCEHCGAICVSDVDEVQQQPCPNEPIAILQWFEETLRKILAGAHEGWLAKIAGLSEPFSTSLAGAHEGWLARIAERSEPFPLSKRCLDRVTWRSSLHWRVRYDCRYTMFAKCEGDSPMKRWY